MSRSYEDLVGALGRAMFFRPERKRVRELWSRDADPLMLVDGSTYALYDVSMNGLSFVANGGDWQAGKLVDLSLQLHGEPVYAGRARVARTEPAHGGIRVGLALDGFLDLPAVLGRDEEARLTRGLTESPERVLELVPKGYLDALTRTVHFVQQHRQLLDRHEARYRNQGYAGLAAVNDLAVRAADALRAPWSELERAASRAAMECLEHSDALGAAKTVTETMLTTLLIDAPMIRRSYQKPLGYPGDYQVMLYYYDNTFEGDSVFARVFHKFFVEHPLSNGVRTRKDYVIQLTSEELARHTRSGPQRSLNVASLGCGPAREVSDFASRCRGWVGEIRWTLIDQEEETLSVAYRSAQRELAGGRGSLHCLNLSFAQLLNEPALMRSLDAQDFIYSTGLFDYLREARAQVVIAALYERLHPGGLLAIGNALQPNEWFWSAELVLDWTLLYRTRDEMFRLAETVADGAQIDVTLEPGGAYYFLLIRKPATTG